MSRLISDTAFEDLQKRSDELGDWHATFPGKKAQDVILIMSTQQKQIERLLEARDAEKIRADSLRDQAMEALQSIIRVVDDWECKGNALNDMAFCRAIARSAIIKLHPDTQLSPSSHDERSH